MEAELEITCEGNVMKIVTKYKKRKFIRRYDLLYLTQERRENIRTYLRWHKEDIIKIKLEDLIYLRELGVSI